MSYETEKAAISRIPIILVKITLDYCDETFGSAPCVAAGTKCYNTFQTCRDVANFNKTTKEYKFSSADTKLPFLGVRPYVLDVKYLPTEIKDNFTISGRVSVSLADEPDTDIGIDPYVSDRASVQGTFWKKLLARNPNYKGRPIEISEGFDGLAEVDFEKKFTGLINNISLGKGSVKIEAVDLLRHLADVEVPVKIDCSLVTAIDAVVTSITLSDVTDIDGAGYVLIGEEIIQYTAKNGTTNQITGCTRGAFETTAATHSEDDKVGKVRYYAADNPFDILQEMLTTDAGLSSANINTTEFAYWKDWPATDIDFSGIITEPTKLSTLYFEIVDLLDAKSWIAEDLKITIRRNIPNEPARSYGEITDEKNIIEGSSSIDLNEKSRITRILLYWDKNTLGKIEETKEYSRLDIGIEADAESANGYNDIIEKKFFCRWLRPGLATEEILEQFVTNFILRQVWRQRDAQPLLRCAVETKDLDQHTGDWVRISSDELQEITGEDYDNVPFQIVKRDRQKEKIQLTLLKVHPRRIAFIAPDATPDYDSASDAQKEYGFICAEDLLTPADCPGYFIY